jgi:hypothetical protein
MLICCRQHNFDSERWFAANNSVLAGNHKFAADNTLSVVDSDSLQTTPFRQRITNSLQTTHFRPRTLIRCRQHNISSKCLFTAGNTISAANHTFVAEHTLSAVNANSLQTTQFRQRITNSLQDTFSATNVNSLWRTQFQQRITNSLQNTHFQQRKLIRCKQLNFGSQSQIHCRTHF